MCVEAGRNESRDDVIQQFNKKNDPGRFDSFMQELMTDPNNSSKNDNVLSPERKSGTPNSHPIYSVLDNNNGKRAAPTMVGQGNNVYMLFPRKNQSSNIIASMFPQQSNNNS